MKPLCCYVAPGVMIMCVHVTGVDSRGRGMLYTGIVDCFLKIVKSEGIRGFYKGWSAVYFRIAPHSFLNLILWDSLTKLHKKVCTRIFF